ncbi:glycosyltransferase family 1 protein [Microbacteriaceae bacterium VKM Ac-2854]|nr:glycosyltransferase family 1 protein [Microbacteriaceae bacterium VKM Ac-2854]
MTLLIVSPDYASHLLPLATLGTEWLRRGERVVVATGSSTAAIVAAFGFEHVPLRLGRGSNPGTIRAEEQVAEEDASLRGFFAATRVGMVATLDYQAKERLTDLLWDPRGVASALAAILAEVRPDQVIVDHLAFTARLALDAAGVRYGDVVLGHPSALTVPGEVYGFPPAWPAAFDPSAESLDALWERCTQVRDHFTAEWNAALAELDATAAPVADAFATAGAVLLLNYPATLHPPARTAALPPHAFLGSAVREEPVDDEVAAWLAADDAPVVYVSFGSFLSVRADVLARVATALQGVRIRGRAVRVAVAIGAADPIELADAGWDAVPEGWLVRGFLPQVTLLRAAALAVTHGGNNSVTESLTAGVPMLVLPFSTDQFAGAAALVDAGFAEALDPNTATVGELRAAADRVLRGPRPTGLSASLQAMPGPARAYAALA